MMASIFSQELILFRILPSTSHMVNPNPRPPNPHMASPTTSVIHAIRPSFQCHKTGSNDIATHIRPPHAAPMTIHVFFVMAFGLGGAPSFNSHIGFRGRYRKYRKYGSAQIGEVIARRTNEKMFQRQGIGFSQAGHAIPLQFPKARLRAQRRPQCIE